MEKLCWNVGHHKIYLKKLYVCTLALAGKFKKWSKNLGSVLKRCEYDVRSTKKIWAQLEVPLKSPSQNMFIGVWLSDLPIACHLQGKLQT